MISMNWFLIFAAALFSIGLVRRAGSQKRDHDLDGHRVDAQRCQYQLGHILALHRSIHSDRASLRRDRLCCRSRGSGRRSGISDFGLSPPQDRRCGRDQSDEVVGRLIYDC